VNLEVDSSPKLLDKSPWKILSMEGGKAGWNSSVHLPPTELWANGCFHLFCSNRKLTQIVNVWVKVGLFPLITGGHTSVALTWGMGRVPGLQVLASQSVSLSLSVCLSVCLSPSLSLWVCVCMYVGVIQMSDLNALRYGQVYRVQTAT
jgi:hypothetical protein